MKPMKYEDDIARKCLGRGEKMLDEKSRETPGLEERDRNRDKVLYGKV